MKKGLTLIEIMVVLQILAIILLGIGWCMNLYKVCTADWEAPYKNEVIRVVGAVVAPVGGVVGYFSIDDTPKDKATNLGEVK